MRPETLRLLDRLGQSDFAYREYGGVADGDPAALFDRRTGERWHAAYAAAGIDASLLAPAAGRA